jgi:catechol 2,3-dioxygenase-like lactoylglutathione lyase family enzyme
MTDAPRVLQLRVVVEVQDYDEAVRFFHDAFGLPEVAAFDGGGDDRVVIFDAGHATLEIANPAHRIAVDQVETAGAVVAPKFRLAFEVADAAGTTDRLVAAGAELLAPPVLTPWMSLNARLAAPGDIQITVFEETVDSHERAARVPLPDEPD